MKETDLPKDLNSFIGSESIDFAVKASHFKRAGLSLPIYLVVIACLSIISAIIATMKESAEVGVISSGNLSEGSDFAPVIVPGIFMLIISAFILYGILIRKGGYLVGTPMRLIQYRKGRTRSIDWEQFTGDIRVSGNIRKGNIALRLKTGSKSTDSGFDQKFVSDMIYASGIPEAKEIRKICKRRIKDNNPEIINLEI